MLAWEEEWERGLLNAAMGMAAAEVPARTWAIFELYVMRGRRPEAVAAEFETTVNVVYLTKKRILTRIREMRHGLEGSGLPA
jgi:DNA-directed RNA polymerase specialized sigma24 family protein